jgi:multidrug resistance protein MdtO
VRFLSDLIRLLQPHPGRLAFAMRLALICALTVSVAEVYQTPEPALTAYLAFFLNREDRAISLIMNLALVVVLTLVIGLILLVAVAVLDDPMYRVISMAVLSFCFLFLASASKLRPIGATVALIAGYGLDQLGRVPVGEAGTRALLYAWLFVGIPAGVSIVVNFLLAPSPRRLAERAIAQRVALCAAMLRGVDESVRHRFRENLREGAAEIYQGLKLAGAEKTSPPADIAALRQAVGSMIVLQSAIDVMDRKAKASLPAATRESLAQTLDQMGAVLAVGGYPTEIAWQAPADEARLSPVAAEIRAHIEDALVRFAEPPLADLQSEDAGTQGHEEPKKAGGFFLPDAFTNPDHVYYALKTTTAAMFCYVLYSLLDWPGIHTCFLTCYIVALESAAESVEKLTLRIAGTLVGAAAGYAAIVFLMPTLTSIGELMAVVFLGGLAGAYVVGGGPRIAYAGFQFAFAFFLCVVQGPSPAFDLTTARDRVIGILLGNLVSFLVLVNFWPVSISERIDPAIAALLRRLGAMMTTTNPMARRTLASQSQAALGAIEVDIHLARYEPDSVRPPPDWLTARRATAHQIGALESPLLLADAQDVEASAQIAGRLEALADRLAAGEAVVAAPGERPRTGRRPLIEMIDGCLERLEQELARQTAQPFVKVNNLLGKVQKNEG